MIHILVTGAAGNIGGALVNALVDQKDYHIIGVDNFLTGAKSKLPQKPVDNFTFIKADVNNHNDISAIMLSYRFTYVFHYAAMVGVQRTLENPVAVLRDIDGIRNVLDLSKNTGVKRVFFSSSSEVYGEPVEFPQNEMTTPLNSRLPYAIVKNVGESFLRSYHKEFGLNFTIFRFFNTYGPKQSEDFVVSRFIKKALQGEDLTIYGEGNQSRTFCYIDDNIETTIRCIEEDYAVNDVMNVGNDQETSVIELAEKIVRLTNSKSKIVFLPPLPEGDMTRRKPDITKMLKLLNRPLVSLEEGILKTVAQRTF